MYLRAVLEEMVSVASGFRARRASFARHSKGEENLSCETNGMNRSRLAGGDQGPGRTKEKGRIFRTRVASGGRTARIYHSCASGEPPFEPAPAAH